MRTPAVLLLSLLLASRLGALTLDEFAGDKTLWESSRDKTSATLAKLRFEWTSGAKDTLRAEKAGKIFALDAGETLLRFDAKTGLPSRLEISLYNRGDRGEIAEKEFDALIARAASAIDAASGAKARSYRNDRQSVVRASGSIWDGKTATYKLEWSKNKDDGKRPEFLRLVLLPAGKADELLKLASDSGAARGAIGDYKPADHLETTPSGDKWLKDVPMVDQGKKGYCAVASTERVMRLYGLPVDEHDIAQLADASGNGGTNPAKLLQSFREQQAKLHVRAIPLIEYDAKFLTALVKDYNDAARKTKASPLPQVGTPSFKSAFDLDHLDGPTLIAGRKKNSAGVKSFERMVTLAIDKGQPVLWGVILGYIKEVPELPQAKGGHMRLIIGYNAKSRSIIYTDSWGAGHERKVMAVDDAFAITHGALTLIP